MKDQITKFFISLKHTFIQLGWLLIIIVPVFVFINGAIYSIVKAQRDTIETRLYTAAESELQNIDLFVQSQLNEVHDDIHVIIDSDEANEYMDHTNQTTIEAYQNMLYRIMMNTPAFINMMMVGPNGDIAYQVTHDTDGQMSESYDSGTIATAFYYSVLQQVDHSKLFISQLYIKNDEPVITFARPLVKDDVILSYLVIDYDANDLSLVLGQYSNEDDTYFEHGIVNNGVIWHIDESDYSLDINTDLEYRKQLFDQMVTNDAVSTLLLPLTSISDHIFVENENALRFYITIDIERAVQNSEALFLNNAQIIAITANILFGVMISYIAYMIRVRKDDRLLINANMYLSVQNQDSIAIINHQLRIIYTNPAFSKMFGFSEKEAYLKKVITLLKIKHMPLLFNLKKMTDYEANVWNKTKSGVYILNHLTIKKESFFVGRDKNYIAIQTQSDIMIDDYRAYMNNKQQVLKELLRFFDYHPFVINETALFVIRFEHATTYDFASYLRRFLNEQFVVTIIKANVIMIYANIKNLNVKKEVIRLDSYIENYQSKIEISNDFTRELIVTKANESVNTRTLLLETAFASLAFTKEKKHLRYLIYHKGIMTHIDREKRIENELENGFKNEEFYIEYQMLQDLSTKSFVGAEALLRWNNPALGQVSPGHFIPVIENSFYINQLSLMVLNLTIHDFEQMIDQLNDDFKISINLSHFDISNDYMIEHMIYKIDQSQLKTSNFIFEITEKQYLNRIDRINHIIDLCHENGILIAVDDFGTGYVSINLLQSIKADFIKIDRSYIKNYPSEDQGVMLDTLIDMVHRFDKPVVIEGVETKVQYQYCQNRFCEYVQGYYLARPMTAKKFQETYHK